MLSNMLPYSTVKKKMRWNHGILELAVAHNGYKGFGKVRERPNGVHCAGELIR
jgi:hypothetical protein